MLDFKIYNKEMELFLNISANSHPTDIYHLVYRDENIYPQISEYIIKIKKSIIKPDFLMDTNNNFSYEITANDKHGIRRYYRDIDEDDREKISDLFYLRNCGYFRLRHIFMVDIPLSISISDLDDKENYFLNDLTFDYKITFDSLPLREYSINFRDINKSIVL